MQIRDYNVFLTLPSGQPAIVNIPATRKRQARKAIKKSSWKDCHIMLIREVAQ